MSALARKLNREHINRWARIDARAREEAERRRKEKEKQVAAPKRIAPKWVAPNLTELVPPTAAGPIRMRPGINKIAFLKTIVAEHYGITVDDLMSHSRKHCHVIPRQVAMYLSRREFERSLVEVGVRFNKDHSSVHGAVEKIEALIKNDARFADEIKLIRERISAG